MSGPKGRKYDPTEELGFQQVERIVTRFGWIPRDVRKADFGVDLDVEYVGEDKKPTGRRIYVQVKSGPSYFEKSNKTHVHHYTDAQHIDYWAGHPGPVAIVLHDEASRTTLWEWTSDAVELDKSWRISVPRSQVLDDTARDIWAAKVLGFGRLDPAKLDEIGLEVARGINDQGSTGVKSTAYYARDDSASAVRSLAQANLGDGELPAAAMAQLTRLFDEKLKEFRSPALEPGPDKVSDPRRAVEDQALHAKIDQLREIKNEGDPDVAYRKLDALIPTIDGAKQPYAYFRARTNRAACALEIGLEKEAIEEFVRVWEIEKTNPHAIANLAIARLFQLDYQGAYDAALESLTYEDAPPHVLGPLFGAAARLKLGAPPLDQIPEKHRGGSEAEFALIEYLRVKNDPSWMEKAIEAFARYPEERAFKRLWMYAVLEQATADKQALTGGHASVPLDRLKAAAEALRGEVERKIAAGYHDNDELANEATNAAVAYRLLDDYQPGIDLLRRVLQYTGHQANAARMLGLLEAIHGDEKKALEVFETVPDDGEAQLFKAEILGQSDPEKGLAHVLGIPQAIIPANHRDSRWIIAAKLAINAGDEAQAQNAIDELRKDPESEPFADIFEAGLKKKKGAPSEKLAKDLISTAEKFTKDTPISIRLSLAEALRRYDSPLAASRVLDGFIDTARDTEASRLYLQLLATSGRDQDFYRAFEDLPEPGRNDPDMVWIKAVHAFNHGDLDEAERQARKLSKLREGDLGPVLLTLEALIRRRREKKVKDLLDEPVEELRSNDLHDRVRLGRLLIGFGYFKRGLDLLYRLLLENRDDPKLWVNFGSAVLVSSRQKDEMFDVSAVAEDVSVTLKIGDTTSELVVEPNPDFRKLDHEARETDHPDVQAIMGLKEGEVFTLPDGRTGSILALRHKFVAKMQTVLRQFEERFPAANGFKSVQVDVEGEGGLDEIKAILKERADFVDEEARSYETGSLPLAVFAYRVGISTIDAAGGLAQTGRKFHVALGNPQEREAATASISANAARGAVVDAQTFYTLWDIEAVDAVVAVVGKLHYAANTMDVLQGRLEMMEASANDDDGHTTMSYQEGGIALVSVAPGDVRRQLDEQTRAITWLEENGVLCPVNLPDDLPDNMREAFAGFDKPLLDEMLIAKERDLLLLVDDLRLRQWARGFVKHSAWLHWVLGHAADHGVIDLKTYTLWSAKLLARGQTYLGLAAQVFIQALSDDASDGVRRPGEVFRSLTKCLGGGSADIESHIRIVCQLLQVIWTDQKFRDLRESATGLLLRAVTSHRFDDHSLVLGVIVRVFRRNGWLEEYIRQWARGHFLTVA